MRVSTRMRGTLMLALAGLALSVSGCGKSATNTESPRPKPATARAAAARSFVSTRTGPVAAVRRVIFLDERERPSLGADRAPGPGPFRGVGRCGPVGGSYRGRRVIGCVVVYGGGTATMVCGVKLRSRVVLNKDARMPCFARHGPHS